MFKTVKKLGTAAGIGVFNDEGATADEEIKVSLPEGSPPTLLRDLRKLTGFGPAITKLVAERKGYATGTNSRTVLTEEIQQLNKVFARAVETYSKTLVNLAQEGLDEDSADQQAKRVMKAQYDSEKRILVHGSGASAARVNPLNEHGESMRRRRAAPRRRSSRK